MTPKIVAKFDDQITLQHEKLLVAERKLGVRSHHPIVGKALSFDTNFMNKCYLGMFSPVIVEHKMHQIYNDDKLLILNPV